MRITIRTKDSVTLTRDIFDKQEVIEISAMCDINESVFIVNDHHEEMVISKNHPILGICTLAYSNR